jgi:hypothetical protein
LQVASDLWIFRTAAMAMIICSFVRFSSAGQSLVDSLPLQEQLRSVSQIGRNQAGSIHQSFLVRIVFPSRKGNGFLLLLHPQKARAYGRSRKKTRKKTTSRIKCKRDEEIVCCRSSMWRVFALRIYR